MISKTKSGFGFICILVHPWANFVQTSFFLKKWIMLHLIWPPMRPKWTGSELDANRKWTGSEPEVSLKWTQYNTILRFKFHHLNFSAHKNISMDLYIICITSCGCSSKVLLASSLRCSLLFPTTSENLAAGGIIEPEPNLKRDDVSSSFSFGLRLLICT